MGSFNATCAVSGLGISDGDEIVSFFICTKQYGESFYLTSPINGKYDDYGRITVDSADKEKDEREINILKEFLIPIYPDRYSPGFNPE